MQVLRAGHGNAEIVFDIPEDESDVLTALDIGDFLKVDVVEAENRLLAVILPHEILEHVQNELYERATGLRASHNEKVAQEIGQKAVRISIYFANLETKASLPNAV
jgi:hypothetical protein